MESKSEYLSKFKPKQGRTLVVGSRRYNNKIDRRTLYDDAIGVDMLEGDGVDIVHDMEFPLDFGMFDHIDICSVLEHVKRPWRLCENLEAIMNDGATITLSVPFVWREHGYPNDYWRMTKSALLVLLPSIQWHGLEYISGGCVVKAPPSRVLGDFRFFKKTEVQGFGSKCTAS